MASVAKIRIITRINTFIKSPPNNTQMNLKIKANFTSRQDPSSLYLPRSLSRC